MSHFTPLFCFWPRKEQDEQDISSTIFPNQRLSYWFFPPSFVFSCLDASLCLCVCFSFVSDNVANNGRTALASPLPPPFPPIPGNFRESFNSSSIRGDASEILKHGLNKNPLDEAVGSCRIDPDGSNFFFN